MVWCIVADVTLLGGIVWGFIYLIAFNLKK